MCHPILALTAREKEAIALVRRGFKNADIAAQMGVKTRTIGDYLYNAMQKLKAKNRIELVLIIDGRIMANTELMPTAANERKLLEAKMKHLKNRNFLPLQIAQKLGIEVYVVYQFFKKLKKSAAAYCAQTE